MFCLLLPTANFWRFLSCVFDQTGRLGLQNRLCFSCASSAKSLIEIARIDPKRPILDVLGMKRVTQIAKIAKVAFGSRFLTCLVPTKRGCSDCSDFKTCNPSNPSKTLSLLAYGSSFGFQKVTWIVRIAIFDFRSQNVQKKLTFRCQHLQSQQSESSKFCCVTCLPEFD